jgi:hypothetical protein
VDELAYVKLQKKPNLFPRLKREGNIGSPEMRRHAMHPVQII